MDQSTKQTTDRNEPAPELLLENFADEIAFGAVSDAVVEGCIEVVLNEEIGLIDTETEDSLIIDSPSRKESKKDRVLDDPLISFVLWLFSLRTMTRLTLLCFILLMGNSLYKSVVEVLSRPHVARARSSSRPFFSNVSLAYVDDYYTGNMRPEWLLKTNDLQIVMYYAPWSTHSRQMRHPYEMTARMFKSKKYVQFAAINCWTVGSTCRSNYKLHTFPVVAAYAGSVSLAYTGEESTDHLFRWVQRLSNPIEILHSLEDLHLARKRYQHVVVAYFPFRNMATPPGYRAYTAAGMIMCTGRSDDDSTLMSVVTSLELAKQLGMRYEGDIQMHRAGEPQELFWPHPKPRTAHKIAEWVNNQRRTAPNLVWINSNRNDELSSSQFSSLLNRSAVLLLALPHQPAYRDQQHIQLITQIASEYWNCAPEGNIQSVRPIVQYGHPFTESQYQLDSQACGRIDQNTLEASSCCRSLFSSVDWNMACASSAKYTWENEERKEEREENHRRRNHWTEQRLPSTSKCKKFSNASAGSLIELCCAIYDQISTPLLSKEQLILAAKHTVREQKILVDMCTRSKLADYMNYRILSDDLFDQDTPNINQSIKSFGCIKNDSLRFAVLDTRQNSFFLNKWGINATQEPTLIAIDTAHELFAVMEVPITQKSVRSFIHDYHKNEEKEHILEEEKTNSRFTVRVPGNWNGSNRLAEGQRVKRLTRSAFLQLSVPNRNLTSDHLVFFSGGRWHAPSTAVLHIFHSLAQYLGTSEDDIQFHVVDTSLNELPYNFNFERLPAVVLFLGNRRDISWKYPDMVPLSVSNLLSFILSRCSARLRWRVALSTCNSLCISRNRYRLRRHVHVLQREIHRIQPKVHDDTGKAEQRKQSSLSQLVVLRRFLKAFQSINGSTDRLPRDIISSALDSTQFTSYFSSLKI